MDARRRSLDRRTLLAMIALGSSALAGCLGFGGDDSANTPRATTATTRATATSSTTATTSERTDRPTTETQSTAATTADTATVDATSTDATTAAPTTETPDLDSDAGFVRALRAGGFVLCFRHAKTDFDEEDTDLDDLTNCDAQRNLTADGREQARQVGRDIDVLSIPIGPVLSSRYCRCLDTAQLAFSRAEPTTDLTGFGGIDDAERERRIEALRRLLVTPPPRGTNTVLVTHNFNVQDAVSVTLKEGEAGVFAPGDGNPRSPVRTIPSYDWNDLPTEPEPTDSGSVSVPNASS